MKKIVLALVVVQLVGCAITPEQKCAGLYGMDGYAKCYEHAANQDYYNVQVAPQRNADNIGMAVMGLTMMNQANYQNQMLWQQQQQNNNLQLHYYQQAMQNAREAAQPYIRPFMDSARH